jgi:hypothetical protein
MTKNEIFNLRKNRILNFKHSGLMGDIIYSLLSIKTLNIKSNYFIDINKKSNITLMNKSKFDFLKPLLESQNYINKVSTYNEEKINYDFDLFRLNKNIKTQHLCLSHWEALNIKKDINLNISWLKVNPKKESKIVIHRSLIRHNLTFDYMNYIKDDNVLFLGLESEYKNFINKYKINVRYLNVENALEFAKIIAGSELFIGNQSLGYAIAEGLKVNRILEIDKLCSNCI